MAQDLLSRLLATHDWLLADGATGTNLFYMGLSSGEPPEFWNVDHPDRIRTLYRGAVEAGSDIFLTNTFGGSRIMLRRHGHEKELPEINAAGAGGLRLAVGGLSDQPQAIDLPTLDGPSLEDAINELAWSLDVRDDPHTSAATRRHLLRHLARQAHSTTRRS